MNNDPLMESLLSQLTEQLQARSFMIATAESCTGGLVAALLTECPGSSNWFERGFVTYSNLAKQESLGVDEQLIQNFGAVSIPVAEAMAAGALNHSQADIALAVTGIAGPAGGSVEKPVGTVCFALPGEDLNHRHILVYFRGIRVSKSVILPVLKPCEA